jgi:hypothetical protein
MTRPFIANYRTPIILLITLSLAACAAPAPTVPPAATEEVPGLAVLPTATLPPTPTAAPTPVPTEAARTFVSYTHPSGVFALNLPDDWEVLDESSEQRLLVRLLPPVGYGSRVTVDITNEGALPPQEVSALAESYVRLHYVEQPGYAEINRAELPDGRLQFVFQYSDGRGASGRETLYIQQAGPYFAALRVFLSNRDAPYLSGALETLVASFAPDASIQWGSAVASINPAELLIANSTLWQGDDDITYYMGEVYNASPAAIMDAQVRVALCSEEGVVLAELTRPTALRTAPSGGTVPFSIAFENVPDDPQVCIEEVAAVPARSDPTYSQDLLLDARTVIGRYGSLIVQGTLTNPTLVPMINVEVVIVIYDAEGRVIGLETVPLEADPQLDPGQSLTFEHTFDELGGEADRYMTFAHATVFNPLDPSLAPTATP